jgi:dual specificity tyrosine-phosphorylation-regulated kinase 2/3/4
MLKLLKDYSNTSAIDVWGLGCIVLEIINGIPLWMTVDTVIETGDSMVVRKGLFSVENRSFRKIIEKQLKVIGDLDTFLVE